MWYDEFRVKLPSKEEIGMNIIDGPNNIPSSGDHVHFLFDSNLDEPVEVRIGEVRKETPEVWYICGMAYPGMAWERVIRMRYRPFAGEDEEEKGTVEGI